MNKFKNKENKSLRKREKLENVNSIKYPRKRMSKSVITSREKSVAVKDISQRKFNNTPQAGGSPKRKSMIHSRDLTNDSSNDFQNNFQNNLYANLVMKHKQKGDLSQSLLRKTVIAFNRLYTISYS